MNGYFIFTALLLTTSMAVQSVFGYALAVVMLIAGICISCKKMKQ